MLESGRDARAGRQLRGCLKGALSGTAGQQDCVGSEMRESVCKRGQWPGRSLRKLAALGAPVIGEADRRAGGTRSSGNVSATAHWADAGPGSKGMLIRAGAGRPGSFGTRRQGSWDRRDLSLVLVRPLAWPAVAGVVQGGLNVGAGRDASNPVAMPPGARHLEDTGLPQSSAGRDGGAMLYSAPRRRDSLPSNAVKGTSPRVRGAGNWHMPLHRQVGTSPRVRGAAGR